jgi:hypothetical protein
MSLEVPPEQAAAWAKLCRLIGSRILETDSCVQTATNDESEGNNHESQSKDSTGR